MATLTIKGIPDALYKKLKARAARERRSINSEVIVCLERELLANRPIAADTLARIDKLREALELPPLTDKLLRDAKDTGRP